MQSNNWQETILKGFIEVNSGYAFKTEQFLAEGIPVVKIGNLVDTKTKKTNDNSYVDPKLLKKLNDYILSENDVLIAMSGNTTCKMARVTAEFSPSLLNQRVGWIKSLSEELNIDFIYYLLTSDYYQKKLWNSATATGQPNLSPRDIKKVRFVKPNPIEQKAIAKILSTVDELIQATKGTITKAERLKKSLMQNLLTGKLKPDGSWRSDDEFYEDEKYGKVPFGWDKQKWGSLITLEYGRSLGNSAKGSVPIYGTNGIIGYTSKVMVNSQGIIIGRKGAYREVHYSSVPFWVIDTAFYVHPKTNFDIKWAYYSLKTINLNHLDSGSAIPSTSKKDVYFRKVIVPPVDDQKQIVKYLDSIEKTILVKKSKVEDLEKLKKSLMQNLLTGKKRIDLNKFQKFLKEEE